jgi:hypothetical protein
LFNAKTSLSTLKDGIPLNKIKNISAETVKKKLALGKLLTHLNFFYQTIPLCK